MKKKTLLLLLMVISLLLVSCGSDDDTVPNNTPGTPTLDIYTETLSNGIIYTSYEQPLVASGGTPPYSWSIVSGKLPDGLSLDPTTGIIGGTPAQNGTYSVTAMVEDADLSSVTKVLTISIGDLSISTSSLTQGIKNTPYSAALIVSGGTAPYSWSIVSGVLPAGLSLDSGTGVISGTPLSTGTYAFSAMVTDSGGLYTSKEFSLTVVDLSITTSSLPDCAFELPYSAILTAAGGTAPYSWSIASGFLPTGLNLDANTGAISGSASELGTFTFTVMVEGSQLSTATRTFSITVSGVSILQSILSQGTPGTPYSETLIASGGTPPYTWSIVSGALPSGLALDANTGEISGTPSATETATFTVELQDSGGLLMTRVFSITITDLVITTNSIPGGAVGIAFSHTLLASGGTAPYTWGIDSGALPTGLALNANTGVISGTPLSTGTYAFSAMVTDSGGLYASKEFSLTVVDLSITTSSLPDSAIGLPYSAVLTAAGGTAPYSWSIASGFLPTGLYLDANTGAISGSASELGTFSFTVTVEDSQLSTAARTFSITVSGMSIQQSILSQGTPGTPYSETLIASGGTPPYTWSIVSGALPSGLALDANTGEISGTPSATETATFTVELQDSGGLLMTRVFSITITDLVITTSSIPGGAVGIAFSHTLLASGGTPPYTWGIVSGALPTGLALNANTGVISGTPVENGTFYFTVEVTDPNGTYASKFFSIMISDLTITTDSPLPAGTTWAPYSEHLAASGGTPPYAWSIVSGSFPIGLFLDANTGEISGFPAIPETAIFTVRLQDAGGLSITRTFSLTISNLSIITFDLSDGSLGYEYSAALTAVGGSSTPIYTWSIDTGVLPTGLVLNPNTGIISGTPAEMGTFAFIARVTEALSGCSDTKYFSIAISDLVITTTALPDGTVGTAYSSFLTSTGGTAPYAWTIDAGTFPGGLSLNGVTGEIYGIPSSSGTFTFSVRHTDNFGISVTRVLSITIN